MFREHGARITVPPDDPGGWLPPPVRHVPSPNFDDRPPGTEIEVVVVHAISLPAGRYGDGCVEALFTNCLDQSLHPDFTEVADLRVSAHLLVDRRGLVTQFVGLDKRAWHAGVSSCLGRERVNDFSIGIELEGCDHESFTLVQYRTLADLLRGLRGRWPVLGRDRIFAHADIAPGRKTDPGPYFDWNLLRSLL